MKMRNVCTVALASVLLVLFLPVFYCVIFIGNNMNYNVEHKIDILYENEILLAFAVVGVAVLFALYYVLRKIPFHRCTIIVLIIFSLIACTLLYVVNVKMSKCIAFYGGWDCGMVANSARWVFEGGELGYEDYYTIYSNNVPVTWLLYKLYSISSELSGYPYNPEFIWIQFQCFMFSAAAFFSTITVLIISRKVAFSVLTLLINCLFLGLSPWKIIPYTDACTIAVPVFVIFLYALFLCLKSKWKYCVWFLMALSGFLGGIMKATCYVPLLAILLVDLVWILFKRDKMSEKLKESACRGALLLCGFLIASCCKNGMYQTLNYDYDRDMAITWTNYLYIGLNEETTGACSGDGLGIVRDYAGQPRYIRDMVERRYIRESLHEKGGRGLIDFWLRKQVMNFNDGTFSWFQEGFFHAWEYDDIIESSWKEPLRKFYWEDGDNFILFNTLSQGIWIFIMLGIIIDTVLVLINAVIGLKKRTHDTENDSQKMCINTVGIVTFVGVFLFVMLFEGRARYLYNSIPVFATMAMVGYCGLFDKLFRKSGICF